MHKFKGEKDEEKTLKVELPKEIESLFKQTLLDNNTRNQQRGNSFFNKQHGNNFNNFFNKRNQNKNQNQNNFFNKQNTHKNNKNMFNNINNK